MAELTVQKIDEDGLAVTFTAAGASGDKIDNTGPNRGASKLMIKNDSAGSVTVTITAQRSSISDAQYGDRPVSDRTVAVAAGAITIIGPFAPYVFNDASGDVNVSYSATTSVTVAAIK